MSCACRESWDLFRKVGREHLLRRVRKRWHIDWKLVFEDTFMRFVCMIVGHKVYDCSDEQDGSDLACRRCHRFMPRRAVKR